MYDVLPTIIPIKRNSSYSKLAVILAFSEMLQYLGIWEKGEPINFKVLKHPGMFQF